MRLPHWEFSMSLRPMISGFDLAKLRSHFGCGDQTLIAAVEAEFAHVAARSPSIYDARLRAEVHEVLQRAVLQGVPFPGLQLETLAHVIVADLLAAHGQELLSTDADQWNHAGVAEAWEAGITTEDGQEFMQCLLFGRPLFGREFDTSWNYYGYLGRAEVRRLRASLREIDDDQDHLAFLSELGLNLPSNPATDLIKDLGRWCDALLAGNKDLWCLWG
jgi:hypothetical protein